MNITIDDAKQFFERHPNNSTPNFKKNHQAPVIRLLKDCLDAQDDVVTCLSKPQEVVDKVKSKYDNPNTVKFYLQALLFFVDQYPNLNKFVDRQKYFKAWQEAKVVKAQSDKDEAPKVNIEYDTIKEKVYRKFGVNSQEGVFIDFYKEAPVRLDFYDIHVYSKTKDIPEDVDKYLNLETGLLFMKNYTKTAKKHGDKNIYLSKELLDKIKYNLKHEPRDILFKFKNKDPSAAVKTLLRKAGFKDASMNTLRHSVHSQEDLTPEQRVEMARRSGHDPTTSVAYSRPSGNTVNMTVPADYVDTIKYIVKTLDDQKTSGRVKKN